MLLKIYIFLLFVSKCQTYNYLQGGDDWLGKCKLNKGQSPINIKDFNYLHIRPPEFHLTHDTNMTNIFNTGFNLEILEQEAQTNFLIFKDKKYFLRQIHFHIQSEHQINGKTYPLEGHLFFTHQNKYLVLAILFEFGTYSNIIERLGLTKNLYLPLPLTMNNNYYYRYQKIPSIELYELNNFLKSTDYYYYKGSTTTPPCEENTDWLISNKILTLSESQYNWYEQIPKFGYRNNRNIQDINGRKIYYIESR